MKTPYLDKQIEELEWTELNSVATQSHKDELKEFKAIKEALSIHSVSSSLRIEDFHIGFEYLQYEIDSERYLNKGMIWKKKKYGFNSPRLHKIKELIDKGEIARCNES